MRSTSGLVVGGLVVAIVALIPPATTSCLGCRAYNWGYDSDTFDRYQVVPDHITPKGVAYDPSGLPINPELIDRQVDEVETCIHQPIDRSSFVVKVAADYVWSCNYGYGGVQMQLPIVAPIEGCEAKGEVPDPNCPCRWRAGIECPNNLITPPNFYLFKDVLMRFVLNTGDPWATSLSQCAMPSTSPTSDGTEN